MLRRTIWALSAMAVAGCGLAARPAGDGAAVALQRVSAQARATAEATGFDGARALRHVSYLTEPAMEGRMTASKGDALADAYIAAHFAKLGLAVTRQPFNHRSFAGTAHNVIAMLPGRERPDRYVVIGAHKDHLGKRWGRIYHGANDNAGGTAAVLEIARVLAERASRGEGPASSVLFMTFSGEELGLIGSTHYTRHPVVPNADGTASSIPLARIAGMVNLDCIAVGLTDSLGTDSLPGARERDGLAAIARRHGMTPVYKPFAVPHGHRDDDHAHKALPPGASSDHAAFRKAGVRAVCFYAEPVFSKYLHSPQDTIPSRDAIEKRPEDRFNIDNLVRIAGVGLDTLSAWADEQ